MRTSLSVDPYAYPSNCPNLGKMFHSSDKQRTIQGEVIQKLVEKSRGLQKSFVLIHDRKPPFLHFGWTWQG